MTEEEPTIKEIEIGYITKEGIRNVVRDMKNGKAAGIDSITFEMLKPDVETYRCVT